MEGIYSDEARAKWYVKQVLDAIDCEDQTNKNLKDVNTCFYLSMNFEDVKRLTNTKYNPNNYKLTQEYVDQICSDINLKNLYNSYIQKYKLICLRHVNQEFVDWYNEFAKHYLNIVISDIVSLGDSRDYPKGLQTTSEYFEDLFENDIVFHKSINIKDFSKVANIFDTRMEELRCKIKQQRELDKI